ncbi:MAG: hypothetical protein LBD58_04215 [Treponema sp.]|jgi:hypothetical protein|nr:hypothetical protein [Treponema sp.]
MAVRPQMGLTFEQIWATIQRIAEKHEELAGQHKDTERFLKESKRELNQAMGKLSDRFGELAERLVSPGLLRKFNALGYAFGKSGPRVKYEDINTGNILAEVDVLLENDGCALAVEIKTHPSVEDGDGHVKRMEILRAYADAHNDKRDYIGAIAGGIMRGCVKGYALKRGFFALEQSGDTMDIAATPEAWKPRKW